MSIRSRSARCLRVLLSLSLVAGICTGQQRDDQRARWMDWGMGPLSPLAFEANGQHLWTVNQPGSRLLRLRTADLAIVRQAPIGPGVASLALHPTRPEVWLVDRVTSTVAVADMATGNTIRSIRVGAEPHGICFTAGGDRAYVTCSAADRVDVLDANAYQLARSIAIPARNPRGIARVGDTVWVVPLLSGNGTAPRGNPATGEPDDVRRVAKPDPSNGETPLPDRDLFAIRIGATAADDALDLAATLSGLGTILYNLRVRPGTQELWIPHTEALNDVFRGEKAFPGGQVVANRVTIVDVSSGTPDPATDVRIVDLDQLAPEPRFRPATPTDVAFTPDGSRAFVCSFGTDRVAVLSLGSGTERYEGVFQLPPADTYPDGVGPRALAMHPAGHTLVSFNKGSNSISKIDVAELSGARPFAAEAAPARPLGFDPLPSDIVQGRIHFNRARNSLSQTTSCGSCHVDGHTDGLAWDLGQFLDPEGTPPDQLAYPLDAKGPLFTQSVRRLREVGPYHWRGEKKRLKDFDAAFDGLLERNGGGEDALLRSDFRYVVQYMEHLAVPANPRQLADRTLSAEAQAGRDLFLTKPVLAGLTCADCHMLPLGTSGEIVDNFVGLAPTIVVPPLRMVGDKLAPPFQVGGLFGERTELGAGLGHSGAFASFQAFLLQELPAPATGPRFDLNAQEADLLAAWLESFDTGLAPASAWQVTAHAGNHAGFLAGQLQFLLDQAAAGSCDVVFHTGPVAVPGGTGFLAGLYDPEDDEFVLASRTLDALRPAEVVDLALSGPPVTFRGLPQMMGRPAALDRDLDAILDLDEHLFGTNPEEDDTDFDEYPDGYELDWGMDPLTPDTSSPDAEPPQLLGSVELLWVTTNALKVEFRTNEPTRVLFAVAGDDWLLRAPLKPRYDTRFSEVVGGLQPGTAYQLRLNLGDPDGNVVDEYVPFSTAPLAQGDPAAVKEWSLAAFTKLAGRERLTLDLRLGLGASAPAPGYELQLSVYYVADDETVYEPIASPLLLTDAAGWAHLDVLLPKGLSAGAGHLYAIVQGATAPPGWPPYVEANDAASFVALRY